MKVKFIHNIYRLFFVPLNLIENNFSIQNKCKLLFSFKHSDQLVSINNASVVFYKNML